MVNPDIRNGSHDDNPLHAEIVIVSLPGCDFEATVLNRDGEAVHSTVKPTITACLHELAQSRLIDWKTLEQP